MSRSDEIAKENSVARTELNKLLGLWLQPISDPYNQILALESNGQIIEALLDLNIKPWK